MPMVRSASSVTEKSWKTSSNYGGFEELFIQPFFQDPIVLGAIPRAQ